MKHSSMLFFALTICACSSANQDDPDPILIVEHDMGIGSTDTSQRPIDDVLVVVDDCQPSEGTPFEMPADGLDATWLGDEIVLSFVDASSEQEGTVKVEKRSVEGELLASARSLTTRVSGPGGGAYPWNFSTAIHTLNNHVGLAFHTQVENADGKGSNVLFQMLADDLTPVTNASIMNDTRWSDYNVDAYVPKITSRNDEFLIFWSDYRMNQPRVSGQNFFLH